jgi:type I restriction enzyme S subunit
MLKNWQLNKFMNTEIITKYKEVEAGTIPKGWIVVNFDKILSLEYGKALKEESRIAGQFPVYGSNGVVGFHNEKLVDGPGIIVGRKGSAGEIIYSIGDFFPIDTTYFVKTTLNKKFVYYLLKNTNIKKLVGSSAVPGLNRNDVYSQEIVIPAKHNEQKQIAEILSSLDDKIELNRKINANLEKLASSLFKKWFVDIGDELPEGWRMGKFSDITEITSGKRPSNNKDVQTDEFKIPLLGASSIMGYVKEYLYNEPILITGRVGTHGIIQKVDYPCWPSDNTLVIKSKFLEFAYHVMKSIDFASLNRGSTQPLITQGDLKNIDIRIPEKTALEKFEEMTAPFVEMVRNNETENQNLSKIRDSLLPRLMSGKIRVNI